MGTAGAEPTRGLPLSGTGPARAAKGAAQTELASTVTHHGEPRRKLAGVTDHSGGVSPGGVVAEGATAVRGREREIARIQEVINAARAGRSGALGIVGEAGIGKSSLLDAAAEIAEGMLIMRARGVESEAELPFSGLHEALSGCRAVGRPSPRAPGCAGRKAERCARPVLGLRGHARGAGRGRLGTTDACARGRRTVARHRVLRCHPVRVSAARARGDGADRRRSPRPGAARARGASGPCPRRPRRCGGCSGDQGCDTGRSRALGGRGSAGGDRWKPSRASQERRRAGPRPAGRRATPSRPAGGGRRAVCGGDRRPPRTDPSGAPHRRGRRPRCPRRGAWPRSRRRAPFVVGPRRGGGCGSDSSGSERHPVLPSPRAGRCIPRRDPLSGVERTRCWPNVPRPRQWTRHELGTVRRQWWASTPTRPMLSMRSRSPSGPVGVTP